MTSSKVAHISEVVSDISCTQDKMGDERTLIPSVLVYMQTRCSRLQWWPHASILGPLFFICYVNDLSLHVNHGLPYLYAGDTALIFPGNSIDVIHHNMAIDLEVLSNWFSANKLAMNIPKTKTADSSSPQQVQQQ